MTYWASNAGWRTGSNNQAERLGNPGRYTSVLKYTSGQLDLTGSNFGYGAILVKTAGGGTASLSGGGDIELASLPNDVIELSVSKIYGGTGAAVYVFKRQQ